MNNLPMKNDKCKASVISSVIGDAIGWPYELRGNNISKNATFENNFIKWTRKTGGPYWNHMEDIFPGEYSDDSQMILSVARSIIVGDWEKTFTVKELPFWLQYERGGGLALKKAARCYKKNMKPWLCEAKNDYFNAGGNGAVMRILPHVIAHNNDLDKILSNVLIDTILTHGHPRAILGSLCYAYSLHYLLNKEQTLEFGEIIDHLISSREKWSKFNENLMPDDWVSEKNSISDYDFCSVWVQTVYSMVDHLKYVRSSLEKGILSNDKAVLTKIGCFSNAFGAGDVAILSALYLFSKYANNPVLGIKTIAFMKGADTDTIASITGGLLGMLNGSQWIPIEWKLIQDYNCFETIVEILLSEDMQKTSKYLTYSDSLIDSTYTNTPIGKVRCLEVREVKSGKNGIITISKYSSLLGQTIYIKNFKRIQQNSISTEKEFIVNDLNKQQLSHKVFELSNNQLKTIIENPIFARITFKKILDILIQLSDGVLEVDEIAKKLKVDSTLVAELNKFFR